MGDFWSDLAASASAAATAALPVVLALAPLLLGVPSLSLGRDYVQDFINNIINFRKSLGV